MEIWTVMMLDVCWPSLAESTITKEKVNLAFFLYSLPFFLSLFSSDFISSTKKRKNPSLQRFYLQWNRAVWPRFNLSVRAYAGYYWIEAEKTSVESLLYWWRGTLQPKRVLIQLKSDGSRTDPSIPVTPLELSCLWIILDFEFTHIALALSIKAKGCHRLKQNRIDASTEKRVMHSCSEEISRSYEKIQENQPT